MDSLEVDGQIGGQDGRLDHFDQTAVLLGPQAVQDLNSLWRDEGQARSRHVTSGHHGSGADSAGGESGHASPRGLKVSFALPARL